MKHRCNELHDYGHKNYDLGSHIEPVKLGGIKVFSGLSDKMCVCYRRVAGLDVAFLDAD